MQRPLVAFLLLGFLTACGGGGGGQAAVPSGVVNGWDTYGNGVRTVACGNRPVLLNGSRTDVTLSGPCRYVRVAGEHNDVTLPIMPGGTVEISGAHNDVFWRLATPGAAPRLVDLGGSNTFHDRTGGR